MAGKRQRSAGSIAVQHPPVNQAMMQQAVQTLAAKQKQPTPQELQQAGAQAAAQMEQAFQQRKAQFQQQQANRMTVLMAQIQPQLNQLQARMGGQPLKTPAWTKGGGASVGYGSEGDQVRPRGLEGGEGVSGQPGVPTEEEVSTRALKEPGTPLMQAPTGPRPPIMSTVPQTATSQQALGAAGSGPPPQQVMPNPTITSLSVAQGQPGDPVMINGSAFGNDVGEVHFVIAPGKDLVAPAGLIWSDNQIFAYLPDVTGVLGSNGTVYIKRPAGNVNSNLMPFRFNPLMEPRQITRIADTTLQQFNGVTVFNQNGYYIRRMHSFLFWGPKGNDHIFLNTRLKNGWVVSQLPVVYHSFSSATDGGTYLIESHVGTDRPHMNVGFWMNDWASKMFQGGMSPMLDYSISILIEGPKGMPDGIVVP